VLADPDSGLRKAALDRAALLARQYDELVPRDELLKGFMFQGRRISFGSFYRGIHRPKEMEGPAALVLVTAPPNPRKPPPYEDQIDLDQGLVVYSYRDGSIDSPDNRALRAAAAARVPLIYFWGIAPGQYQPVLPVFVVEDSSSEREVLLEVGPSFLDLSPAPPAATEDQRAYRLREVSVRLHQNRFRADVLRAYRDRCAVCRLRERSLVQAAHIIEDPDPKGIAAVINGIALCAIHHLAYDRNLLGIAPNGVVHIGKRLRETTDGPMLTQGLQSFHGTSLNVPARRDDRPDPDRLEIRFSAYQRAQVA
jgi:putative restriction endonuclease